MPRHRADVSLNQHTTVLGRDPENVGIGRSIWDNAGSSLKIDRRLSAP